MSGYAAPVAQLGYLSPLPVVDAMHYEFYQAVPRGLVLLSYPLSIAEFTPEAALDCVARADEALDYLGERGVERVIFGGLPVSALVGRPRMLALMEAAGRRHGMVVSSDFEDTVQGLHKLGAKRPAVAAKWKPSVMAAVAAYLADAGFEVAGFKGADFGAREVARVHTPGSAALAIELGQSALREFTDADALVLGGGTWLSIPATVALEREFGKPVVSNMASSFWSAARHAGVALAPGLGCKLFDL